MDWIQDKSLYAAVMFARRLMREGMSPGLANFKAAQYHGVYTEDVAHYTGQVGGKCAQKRTRNNKKKD